ncbi:putative lectin receptor kinase [Hordeum vulgare]|nr:putative lectin receptor kinase [Hordeum vulgare]
MAGSISPGAAGRSDNDGARSVTPDRGRSHGRSRHRRQGKEIVVHERTIQERLVPGGTTVWPMLTPTNYFEWSMLMQINMEANLMWNAVEGNLSSVPNDKAVLATILRSVPPEMVGAIVVKKTTKEAWDTIKTMRMGVARVREATAQQLCSEFLSIAFRDGETLDAFGMRITLLVYNLRSLGDTMDEVRVVQKFLRVIPSRYMQIALATETMLDLNTLSVEELVGRLRSAEERYLTNDQVLLQQKTFQWRQK